MNRLRWPLPTTRSIRATVRSGKVMLRRLVIVAPDFIAYTPMMCILQHSKLENAVKWSDAELLHQPLGPKDYRVEHALQQFCCRRREGLAVQMGLLPAG